MADVCKAIKEVAAKYSIPVLDLHDTAGMYPKIANQKAAYYTDGVHLSDAGQTKVGKMHVAFLLANYPK